VPSAGGRALRRRALGAALALPSGAVNGHPDFVAAKPLPLRPVRAEAKPRLLVAAKGATILGMAGQPHLSNAQFGEGVREQFLGGGCAVAAIPEPLLPDHNTKEGDARIPVYPAQAAGTYGVAVFVVHDEDALLGLVGEDGSDPRALLSQGPRGLEEAEEAYHLWV